MARLLPAVGIAVVAFGLTLLLANLSFFAFLELKGLDLLFTLRGPLPPPKNIIIVAIDEPSMAEIGQQWPWPRSLHAQLIQQLNKAGAKLIGFDVLFTEPSEPAEDQALAHALRKAGNVVLVNTVSVINDPLFHHILRLDPLPIFRNAALVGSPLISIDADGVVRSARLLAFDQPSFAQQIVQRFQTPGSEDISRSLGGLEVRGGTERLINYLGPSRTVKTVSYYQALDYQRLLPPGIFNNKIVLVGRSLEASPMLQQRSSDMFLTPFSWVNREPVAGIEIQAMIMSNLLEDRFINALSRLGQWTLLFIFTLASSLLIVRLPPVTALVAIGVLVGFSIIIIQIVFTKMNLWFPLFSSILSLILVYGGHLLFRTLRAEHERRYLLETMNRELEFKVTERTRELSIAHQELIDHHQQLEITYQKLAQTQQQLVHSEKMASLGLLVAGVAHELNNPISYVNSNLEFIEDYAERLARICATYSEAYCIEDVTGLSSEDCSEKTQFETTLKVLRELIVSCKDGTRRVKNIVLDLQTFSRTDDVDLILVDVHEGLESTLNLLARQYHDRITIHRDYGRLPLVECYSGQINQVFMNLLQNAVQAIPDYGDIWISTGSDENWVTIVVKDSGLGISEAHLGQIFDPFFTTKPVGAGTGLGLSIAYGIMQRHGGQIHVSSIVNKGTEFTIKLPIGHP